MFGVMSRGYICPIVPDVIVAVEPPAITDASAVAPEISGSAQEIGERPTLTGAAEQVPTIAGAASSPTTTTPDSPSLTGGNLLVPEIRKAEEE
jgi:hypothetical protein